MSTSAVKVRTGFLIVAITANLVVAGTLSTGEAHACSCAGVPTAEESLRTSDVAFLGEVTDVEGGGPLTLDEYTTLGTVLSPVTFDVKEYWKGTPEDGVVVHGQGPRASCGIDFDKGKKYLVFAYSKGKVDGGPLETNSCSATSQVSGETALRVLGPPQEPLPDTGGTPPSTRHGATATVTAVIALSVAGALLVRRVLLS